MWSAVGTGLGYGQTWADYTSVRALGVTYTNNTGKPIAISVTAGSMNYCVLYLVVQGVTQGPQWSGGGGYSQFSNMQTVVPIGAPYSATATNCGLASWQEMR